MKIDNFRPMVFCWAQVGLLLALSCQYLQSPWILIVAGLNLALGISPELFHLKNKQLNKLFHSACYLVGFSFVYVLLVSLPQGIIEARIYMVLLIAGEVILLLFFKNSRAKLALGVLALCHLFLLCELIPLAEKAILLSGYFLLGLPLYLYVEKLFFVYAKRSRRPNEKRKRREEIEKIQNINLGHSVTGALPLFVLSILFAFFLYTTCLEQGVYLVAWFADLINAEADNEKFSGSTNKLLTVVRKHKNVFSDEALLNRAAGLGIDKTKVMEVEFYTINKHPFKPQLPVYLRGFALETYRDGSWHHQQDTFLKKDQEDGEVDGLISLDTVLPRSRFYVWQQIEFFDLTSQAIFALPDISAVSLPEVESDNEGSVFLPYLAYSGFKYTALSHCTSAGRSHLSKVSLSKYRKAYLQLPKSFEQVHSLAKEITAESTSLLDKCNSIEAYLVQKYSYSLTGFVSAGQDPVNHFLFARKSGCCIHFASSMVVMLRTLGIPSRLACGYVSEEFQQENRKFIFRSENAHAWVEVYFSGFGWVSFDPSPERNAEAAAKNMAKNAGEGSKNMQGKGNPGFAGQVMLYLGRLSNRSSIAVFLVLVIFSISYYLLHKQMCKESRSKRKVSNKTANYWRKFVKVLQRRGIKPARSATPMEVAVLAKEKFPQTLVEQFIKPYCVMRYSEAKLSKSDLKKMRLAIEEMKKCNAYK